MKIDYESPYALIDFYRNAKVHPESQIEALKASIQRFGFTQPIVIDRDKTIIAGHARRTAAIELGLLSVPVVRLEALSKEETLLLCTIDNDLHRQATDDQEKLLEAMSSLEAAGESLGDFGLFLGEKTTAIDTLRTLSFQVPKHEYEDIEARLIEAGEGDVSKGFLRLLEAYA